MPADVDARSVSNLPDSETIVLVIGDYFVCFFLPKLNNNDEFTD